MKRLRAMIERHSPTTDEAVIVIPVYKETLSLTEWISLRQAYRILGRYPICFMAPEKMRPFLEDMGCQAAYFPDIRLSSRLEYSKLLLEAEFYQRFQAYQYMLIYQTDAFVFSDRLHDFCALGYDYIGAPIAIWPKIDRIRPKIGNGGFSLRKIESCIRVLSIKKKIYQDTGAIRLFEQSEDLFFAYCGAFASIEFSVPARSIAIQFALEYDMAHRLERYTWKGLPFGCHAWTNRMLFDGWRPYIASFTGQEMMNKAAALIMEEAPFACRESPLFGHYRYLMERIMRYPKNRDVCHKLLVSLFSSLPQYMNRTCILWGGGMFGTYMLHLLTFAKIRVHCIFDRNAAEIPSPHGILHCIPRMDILRSRHYFIVISTSKYYGEIAACLSEIGLQEGIDFFSYHQITTLLVTHYYGEIGQRYQIEKSRG